MLLHGLPNGSKKLLRSGRITHQHSCQALQGGRPHIAIALQQGTLHLQVPQAGQCKEQMSIYIAGCGLPCAGQHRLSFQTSSPRGAAPRTCAAALSSSSLLADGASPALSACSPAVPLPNQPGRLCCCCCCCCCWLLGSGSGSGGCSQYRCCCCGGGGRGIRAACWNCGGSLAPAPDALA